jgi:uncharacterized protein YoaH (UPF0181 family)
MRTYIELRNAGGVLDWRVIIDPTDATIERVAERVRELTWNGMRAGDTIAVYESELEAEALKLPR